jgi:UbiA prenyltransferase family
MRPWLELARISNLPTVWTNVLAGWLLAGGKWEWQPLAWLLLGGSLLYTGGMILNDAADVKYDREHRKERPIPSGRVTSAQAWTVGLGMMLAGAIMAVWGATACIWLTSGLIAAILFYDLYHKPWAGSVFVMGSCRTLLYLVAASAAAEHLTVKDHWEVIVKAIAMGGYVVGLSLYARREATGAESRGRWSLENILLEHIIWVVTFYYTLLGGKYWMSVLLFLFVLVLDRATKLMRTPPPSNIGRAVGLLLAAIPLVDALAVSQVAPGVAVCFACSMPLLLLWQRKIAAT